MFWSVHVKLYYGFSLNCFGSWGQPGLRNYLKIHVLYVPWSNILYLKSFEVRKSLLPFPDPCPLRVVYALNYNIRETDLFATRVKYCNEAGLSYFRDNFFCKHFLCILYDNQDSQFGTILINNCTFTQEIEYMRRTYDLIYLKYHWNN